MGKTKSNNKKVDGTRITRSQAETIVTIRVILLVIFDIAASFWFDYVITLPGERELAFHKNLYPTLVWVSVVLFALSVIYFVVAKFMKLKTVKYFITPEMIASMTFVCMSAMVLYDNFRVNPILLYTMMVILSVFLAIYYIYTMLFY